MGKLPETAAVHHIGENDPITLPTCGLRTGGCGDGLVVLVSAANFIPASPVLARSEQFLGRLEVGIPLVSTALVSNV